MRKISTNHSRVPASNQSEFRAKQTGETHLAHLRNDIGFLDGDEEHGAEEIAATVFFRSYLRLAVGMSRWIIESPAKSKLDKVDR